VLDLNLTSNKNPLERIGDAIGDFGSAAGNIVIPLGYLFQIILVMILIRSLMRDDKFEKIGWLKSLGYALIFTTATPLLGIIVGALAVWLLPYAWQILSPLAILGKLSEVNADSAAATQPWAYTLAILSALVFFLLKKRNLKSRGRSFSGWNYFQVVVFAIVANLLSQFLVYSLFNSFLSKTDKDFEVSEGKIPKPANLIVVPDENARKRDLHKYFSEYHWTTDSILAPSSRDLISLWLLQLSRFHYNHAKIDADDPTWQTVGFTWRTQTGVCRDSALLLADLLVNHGIDARLVLGETKGPDWLNNGSKHAWVVVKDKDSGKEYILESTMSSIDFKLRTPPLVETKLDYFAETQVTASSYRFNRNPVAVRDYTNGWETINVQ